MGDYVDSEDCECVPLDPAGILFTYLTIAFGNRSVIGKFKRLLNIFCVVANVCIDWPVAHCSYCGELT